MRRVVAVIVGVSSLLVARAAAQTADAHLGRGLEAFEDEDYEAAISEFRAGYAIDPRPELLFAWAQAERLSGDCPSAIVLYRRFLETGPPERQAAAAQSMLDRCEAALATTPKEPVEPEPEVGAAGAVDLDLTLTPPPAPPRREARPPWYADVLGGALAGAGVVTLGVGVGMWLGAEATEDDAAAAETYDQFAALMDEAGDERRIAGITLAVGAGLIGAGVVRYVIVRRDAEARVPTVTAWSDGAGGGLAVSGSF
jgi:tetratricopeptide (TPR) repeat protein